LAWQHDTELALLPGRFPWYRASVTFRFVLAGGLVAATLDILYACGFWALKSGVPAQRILQGVAAGLLGDASFEGGWGTAALGLLLHYLIATSMAVAYFLVARRWRTLVERPVFYGAAYGLMLYVLMNYVVVPLSAAGSGSRDLLWIGLTIAVHAFFIGVPIALFTRRALAATRPSAFA
jgi:hypothetical protein